MVKAGVVALVLLAAGGAPPRRTRYAGEWTGKYVCGAGRHGDPPRGRVDRLRRCARTGAFLSHSGAKGEAFGGRMSGFKGCSTFSLTHEPVSRLMPLQCAVAAPVAFRPVA
jgi:hypothetical protein